MINKVRAVLLLCLLWLAGCANNNDVATATPVVITSTPRPLITLAPTFTPLSGDSLLPVTPTPYNNPTPIPTPVVTTDFNQTVIEFRYRIPAIGLDRRIEGKAGSQIIIIDEATQTAFQRDSQGSILLELQQVLPTLILEPLPEGCTTCVQFEFKLPLSDIERSGWLTDIRTLASVENYTTAVLGPHYPPNTQIALHRHATSFYPAHTLAVTADGRLWIWFSIEPQIQEATLLEATLPTLPDFSALQSTYATPCLGLSNERLFLQNTDNESRTITLECPAYTIPTTLQPLYMALDSLIAPQLARLNELPEQPPFGFPLDAVVQYARPDGSSLSILQDSTIQIRQDGVLTGTNTLTNTTLISLTNSFLATGELQLGLNSFPDNIDLDDTSQPNQYRLLVRATSGVYDGAWSTAVAFLQPLDTLIDQQLTPATTPTPESTEDVTTTPEATEEATTEPTPEATEEGTVTPSPTPEP